jgi:hypothetical protein
MYVMGMRFIHLAMIKTIRTPESHVLRDVATVSLSLAQPHHRAPADGEMAVQQQRSSAVVWTQDSDRLLLERIQHFVKQGLEVLLLLLLPPPPSVAVAGGWWWSNVLIPDQVDWVGITYDISR